MFNFPAQSTITFQISISGILSVSYSLIYLFRPFPREVGQTHGYRLKSDLVVPSILDPALSFATEIERIMHRIALWLEHTFP